VEIQPSAFRFCDGIISISLPESIKSIAVSSFEDCINLQKIEFAAVEQVDNYAFSNCPNLREVPVQNIKKRIGVAAFKDCISLGKICFSDTITVIDSAAFKGCSCLEWSTLPSSIGKICGSGFRGNSALKEVRLPKSVSMIKKSAFRECSNLETVEINSDKIEIERNVFRDCEKLYDSSIPPGSVVRKSAFINCPMKDVIMMGTTEVTQLQIPISGYFRTSYDGEYSCGSSLVLTDGVSSERNLANNAGALNKFIFDYDSKKPFEYGTFINDDTGASEES